jgi:uncharacterized protein
MVTEQAARTITGFRPADVDRSTLAKWALKGPRLEFSTQEAAAMPGSEQPISETSSPAQTASDAFWAAAELGTGLIELDRAECMELLAAQSVGRIAYAINTGARILPVNYILGDDCIIFRTVPDGEIFRHALNSNCAFEIDETDEFFESGWSVVAVGRLQLATEDDFASMRYGKQPEPWAGGSRWMFVRLPCEQVSGRRVIGHGR